MNPVQYGSTLRDKALLALEEAVQEARYRRPRRSFALRFALAYLWSLRPGERAPYETFWKSLARDDRWRFQASDFALLDIYRTLGLERDHELFMAMWVRRAREEEEAARRLEEAGSP